MANEIDVGGIVMRIRADMSGVKQGVDQLQREMTRMKGSTDQTGAGVETASKKMASTVKAGSLEQAAAYAAIAAAATKAMQIIFSAIDTGVNAINRYRAALIGLESVATGNGIGSDAMQAALDQVSDAFFDVASASTAFKNLISRGYDLDQATASILRLKDAAAFGRQASLGLADAVVSATEGLKNENSILVDNAGVTKNVAKMWDEYAKSIGTTADKLTQQQKIEAEYQGIMQETRFQVGDLAKLQLTLAGTQAATALAGEELARAYGEAMSPAVNTATQIWGEFLNMLTEAVTQFPGVVAGLTATGIAVGGLVVAQKAALAFQALSLALHGASGAATLFGMSLKVAFPALAAIGLAVGVATAIFTNHAEAERIAAEKAEAAAKKEIERKNALEASAEELKRLGTRFDELSGKQNLTYAESEELLEIEKTLKEQYGITGTALRDLADDYGTVTAAIREKRIEVLRERQADKEATAEASRLALEDAQAKVAAANEYTNLGNAADRAQKKLDDLWAQSDKSTYNAFLKSEGADLYSEITALKMAQSELINLYSLEPADMSTYGDARGNAAAQYVRDQIDAIAGEYEIGGGVINEATKGFLDNLFTGLAADPKTMVQTDPDKLLEAYGAALSGADIGPALQAMEEIQRKVMLGAEPKPEDLNTITSAWDQIYTYALQVGRSVGMSDSDILNFATQLAPVMTSAAVSVGEAGDASVALFDLWKNQSLQGFVSADAEGMKTAMEDMRTATEAEAKRMNAIGASLRGETGVIGALELLKKSMESGDIVMIEVARKGLESLGQQAPESFAQIDTALEAHRAYRASYVDDMGTQMDQMNQMLASFVAKQAALAADGKQDTAEYRAIEAYIQRLEEARRMAAVDYEYKGLTLVHPDQQKAIDDANRSTADWMDTQTELNKQMETATGLLADYNLQMQALQTLQAGYQTGETETQAFKDAEAYLKSIPEFAYMALDSMDVITMQLEMQQILIGGTEAQIQDITARSQAYLDTLKQKLAGMDAGTAEYTTLNGMIVAFERLIELGGQLGAGAFNMSGVTQAFDMTKASAEELQAELDRSADKSRLLTKALEEKVSLRATIAEIKRVADAQMDNKASAEDWARAQRDAAAALGYTGSSAEQMSAQAALALGNVDAELAGLQPQIQNIMNWIQSLLSYISSNKATLNINTSPAVSALNGLVSVWNAMANSFLGKLLGWKPVGGAAPRSGGGGGGGGSKTDPAEEARRYAEEAAREAEERRRDAVRADLRQLDHKRTMNQLTVQQEIAALEQIKRAHRLNADELMDIDERIYEARERLTNDAYQWALTLLDHQIALGHVNVNQEIARLEEIKRAHELSTEELYQIEERLYNLRQSLLQEQEAQVKTTYDRIVKALKARYDEQKRMELDALDDRIDTLNAITKAENEADRRDDFAQNLADKQRELSVTKSARRRRELEAEIAEMQADEARRLAQERRQAEIDEINKQKQAVSDKYSKLAEEENLRQEALRLVMSNNLDQMAQLIASYGDKWQDAGAQLAEALTNGVLANSNGIIGSLNTLADSIQSNIDFQLRGIGSNLPVGSTGGVTVNMYGLTVREDADVDLVARAIQQKIQAAGR